MDDQVGSYDKGKPDQFFGLRFFLFLLTARIEYLEHVVDNFVHYSQYIYKVPDSILPCIL